MIREQLGRLAATPIPGNVPAGGLGLLVEIIIASGTGAIPWSDRLLDDLGKNGRHQCVSRSSAIGAEGGGSSSRTGKRAAVPHLGPDFSKRISRCSFLSPGAGAKVT